MCRCVCVCVCVKVRGIDCSCCLYAVGRTTRRHPATSSRIFFPLHLFSPRSCHRLSTAEHRLRSIHAVFLLPGKHFPFISPSIVARTTLSLLYCSTSHSRRSHIFTCKLHHACFKRQICDGCRCCVRRPSL